MAGPRRRASELEAIKTERAALRDAYLGAFSSLGASNCGLFPAMATTRRTSSEESTWSAWCRSMPHTPQPSSPGETFLAHMSSLSRPVSHDEWLKECRGVQPVHHFLRRGEGRGCLRPKAAAADDDDDEDDEDDADGAVDAVAEFTAGNHPAAFKKKNTGEATIVGKDAAEVHTSVLL
jgi:hypothetical protein